MPTFNPVQPAVIPIERWQWKVINKLLLVVGNDTPANDKKFVELDLSLNPVIENEEKYHPIDQCFFIRSEKNKIRNMAPKDKSGTLAFFIFYSLFLILI